VIIAHRFGFAAMYGVAALDQARILDTDATTCCASGSHPVTFDLVRTPAERAAIGERLDEHTAGRGASRAHRVGEEFIDAVERAIITDRRELGRVVSRSGSSSSPSPPPQRPPAIGSAGPCRHRPGCLPIGHPAPGPGASQGH
jgi:hypothetical protein